MIQKEVNLVREKRYLFGIILLFFIFTISLFQFLSAGNTGDIGVDFSTGGMQCERTDTTAFWYNASNPAQDKINASNNCSVYKEMNGDFCCPTKDTLKYCDVNISVNGVCGDGRKITRCSDYKTKDECKADAGHVGNVSGTATTCGQSSTFYMSGQACVNVTDCSCYWNNANNSCNALANYSINCRDHIDDTGHCIWYALIEEDRKSVV